MNPLNNKNTTNTTMSPRVENNTGPSRPSVSQLNTVANRPEGLQQARAPQSADRHYTRLMRLLNNPQASLSTEDLRAINQIADFETKEKLLDAIIQHPNTSEDVRIAAERLLDDLLWEAIYNKEYDKNNIWEAYTDAHKIRSPEKQAEFLKRILQSHIEMKSLHPACFLKFQDLIKDFEKPIQEELYGLLVNANQSSLQLKILGFKQMMLSLDEQEVCLSNILDQLLVTGLSQYDWKKLQAFLKDFPKPIQNKAYIQVAKSDCNYSIRLHALNLMDMPLDEKIPLCCSIFSQDFCQELCRYSEFPNFRSFLRSCPKALQSALCSQIAKYDSLLSPVRIQIVELMESSPEGDEALSVMLASPYFKFEDKIKLVKLINDPSKKLSLLQDLLANAPYAPFEHPDKYKDFEENYYEVDIKWKNFDYEASLALRLEACTKIPEASDIPDLKYKILEQFFGSCPVNRSRFLGKVCQCFIELNQDEKNLILENFPREVRFDALKGCFDSCTINLNHFIGILDVFFEEGSDEEKQLIMLKFPTKIRPHWCSYSLGGLKGILDRFERFYLTQAWDQETKKTFVMNLFLNPECPKEFQQHVWLTYLDEFPEELEAPVGGILETIAVDTIKPKAIRQSILRTLVKDNELLQELLVLTEETNAEDRRFKRMKLPSPDSSSE